MPKIPESGSSFGVSFQEFRVSEQQEGQVGAKCCFLGFTIPWKLEQSGTWILSLLTFQLLQLPWNWALRRPKHLLEKSLGKGSVQRLFPLHFRGIGFGGIFPGQGGSLGVLSPVLWEQQLAATVQCSRPRDRFPSVKTRSSSHSFPRFFACSCSIPTEIPQLKLGAELWER